ncbi:hypothetical protein PSHT_07868 [Puccinia striiformis]|uniref:HAT C-terminal dimerisation domain-containing protein n=1 Tax=Puccinia striiformis TaxID=27350 RepID=A0A2S4VUI7_9BASI|nr:hypothetical protein PSHT_07868 [Puccinia striiformis]
MTVIKQLLENGSDKYIGKSADGHFFKSYELSSQEWEDVNNLNNILRDFLELTKWMEGDGPKLPMVLYEYVRIMDSLERKQATSTSTALETIFVPMIAITRKYMNFALACDTVIMATFLHPAWRMMLFTRRFELHVPRITRMMVNKFSDRDELLKSLKPPPPPPKVTTTALNASPNNTESEEDEFNFYPTNPDAIDINTGMERYNNGDFPMDKKGDVMAWWKLRSKDFPVLASLARDYRACPASSAAVERTFSAAANICASGRSGLAI